jgi:hypothetical protein
MAIESLATKGTLTGRNKSQVVWLLPYIAEGVGFFRNDTDEYENLLSRIEVLKLELGYSDSDDSEIEVETTHLKKCKDELKKFRSKLETWDARAAFVDAVVCWNKYRFARDMMEHCDESITELRRLRIAAIKAIVAHVPQTSGFQAVVKISLFFQYEYELMAIGRVLQFDTGVMESGNRGLRALYHIIQSQGGSSAALHRCVSLAQYLCHLF